MGRISSREWARGRASLVLTTKREQERVSGSERPLRYQARASLINRSRDFSELGSGAGTSGVVSRGTRAPTALATGAIRNVRPDDSGLMMPGSPRDRRFELKSWFESYVPVHVI